MKKNLLITLLSLITIVPLTSAAGIGSFFSTVDPSTLVLGCLFLIFFALANFSLGKFFKDRTTGQPNKAIVSVLSFCVSLLFIYGIYRSNLNYSGFLDGLGVPSDTLMIILAVLLAAGLIFMLIKLKTRALLFTGLFLIFLAYFAEALNIEIDKGKLLVTGGIILFLWLITLVWMKRKERGGSKKKDNVDPEYPRGPDPNNPRQDREGGQTSERDRNTVINDDRQINVNIQGIDQIVQAIINSRTGGNEDQAIHQLEERLSRMETELREARRAYEESLNMARRNPQNVEIKNNINISLKYLQKMQKEKEQAEQKVTEVVKVVKERKRTLLDLKQKYLQYLFYYHRKGIGKHKREEVLRAMNIILSYVQKMNKPIDDFLSNKVGGTNAKHTSQLQPPWDD